MLRPTFFKLSAKLCLALSFSISAQFATAQTYPNKPVKIVVGYSPGGPVDILGRVLAQGLSTSMGQSFIVENKGGAAGAIGAEQVARSPADGYTLLTTVPSVFTIVPHTLDKARVQAEDFAPVIQFAESPLVLAVNPSVPANNLKELIALLNKPDSRLSYASAGDGTLPHLAMELLLSRTGGRPVHVPYKGSGPAVQDLVGGQVNIALEVLPTILPMVKAGRVKALAVTSRTRVTELPNVPTVSEAGVSGYEAVNWFGLYAPAATPKPIIEQLRSNVEKVVTDKEMQQRFSELGAVVAVQGPAETAERLKRESQQWGSLIQKLGLKSKP
ncbi:Bug family tripartite tricarboxylate transporter substrate binding protein [Ottowia thiooxydans]|uniref:Bug family tripartite tricarboxylate transporter substrate binding protein n=1 Tax=Ottowia thiooxydans TaxID=219182 RepID=UPI000427D6B9|nr:tripartite tricarboxylate transporter substrate binding protein [Ottowia thiooxydans]